MRKSLIPALLSLVVALLCATPALAADPEQTPLDLSDPKPAPAAPPDTGAGLLRTFIGLVVVVVVIYALYWLLRQLKASREERASGFGLESVATLPLGPGRSLHMVRSGRELVLVGVSERGVTPIRTWTEDEAAASGLLGSDDDLGPPIAGAGAGDAPARAAPATLFEALRRRTVRR